MERFTLGRGRAKLVEHSVFALLLDLPHECGHVLQNIMQHYISPAGDDGWLAEHDPSACVLTLLKCALNLQGLDDDFHMAGLYEACEVVLCQQLRVYRKHVGAEVDAQYLQWKQSCGYVKPDVEAASIGSDYLKWRLAWETGILPANILAALFNRTGDIRTLGPPAAALQVLLETEPRAF